MGKTEAIPYRFGDPIHWSAPTGTVTGTVISFIAKLDGYRVLAREGTDTAPLTGRLVVLHVDQAGGASLDQEVPY